MENNWRGRAKAKEKRGEVVVGENRSCNVRDGKSNFFVRPLCTRGEREKGKKKDRSYTRRTIKDERKDVTSALLPRNRDKMAVDIVNSLGATAYRTDNSTYFSRFFSSRIKK